MGSIGPLEILLILVVALLVFGPKRLPEVGRSVGRGLREFRRASTELRDEFERSLDVDEETAPAPEAPPPAARRSESGGAAAPVEPADREIE